MKKVISFLIITIYSLSSFGQTWFNAGDQNSDRVYDLIKFKNELYAGGRMGVQSWNGTTWNLLPYPSGIGYPLTLAAFQDTLYAGGDFAGWTGSRSKVFKYDGTNWIQAGGDFDEASWSSTKQLLLYNNKLVSGGRFSSINGKNIMNIAAWNGTNWDSLGQGLNGTVYNLAEHNGNLFASGLFTASGTDSSVKHIAKWDGIKWSALDSAQSLDFGNVMISFDSMLFIGNVLDTISGIEMHGIAAYDGSTFHSKGDTNLRYVTNFWVYNNELYLCGEIYVPNTNQYKNVVLKYNGSIWQQVGANFNQGISCLEDYNNQLLSAGSFTIVGTQTVSHIAQLQSPNNILETDELSEFQLYPNPTNRIIHINAFDKVDNISCYNIAGETIPITWDQQLIDLGEIPVGTYLIQIESAGTSTSQKVQKY